MIELVIQSQHRFNLNYIEDNDEKLMKEKKEKAKEKEKEKKEMKEMKEREQMSNR